MKKTLSVLVALMLCLGMLSACGGGSGDSAPALSGKYVCSSFGMGNEILLPAQLTNMGIDPEKIYFEFHDEKNCTLIMMGEESSGTYRLNDTTLSVTFDGVTEDITLENDKISMYDSATGYSIVFTKE